MSFIQQEATLRSQFLDERVGNTLDDENLFLANAEDVVVESASRDDGCCGLVKISGFIDDDGWIAGARADRALRRAHRLANDRRTARHEQQPNLWMIEEGLARFDGRLLHAGDEVGRTACILNRAIKNLDAVSEYVLRSRMRVEDRRIARRNERNGIVGHRRQRMRDRRHRANDAERCEFIHREAVVAREAMRLKNFNARRFGRDQLKLLFLMIDPPHAGLGDGSLGKVAFVF